MGWRLVLRAVRASGGPAQATQGPEGKGIEVSNVVSIDSHRYPIDITKVIRRPVAALRQQVDQGARTGEETLDNSALWKRTCSDFILGQGQEFFDQEQESNERRMWAVENFDPLSDRRALTTAPSWAEAVGSFTASGSYHRLIRTASNFWWGSGSQLHRSASHTSFSTTSISGGPGTSEFRDMTVFGTTVYVAYETGVYSGSATGSSVSSFSSEDCDVISADFGRLVCGHDNELFELTAGATRVDIYDHPNTAWDWTSFAAGTAGIYVAGHDGLKSEVYLITIIDATGALAPPFPVAALPQGELVRRIAFFGGFLIMATSKGVRVAQASQSGLLSYGPLIELGDTKSVHFEGRFAYVTVSSSPQFDNPGVIALDMSRFTAPLTPAYAVTQSLDTASTYTVHDVASYEGRVLGLLNTGGNSTLRYSSASAYATGKYWSGTITFSTPELKNHHYLEIKFDPLISGQSVYAEVRDRIGGTLYTSTTANGVGDTGMTLPFPTEMLTESAVVYISAVGNASPVVIRRWTLRAVVAPYFAPEEIILPLQLFVETKAENYQAFKLDPEAEWEFLVDKMRSRTPVTLKLGSYQTPAWIDQVATDGYTAWNRRQDWPEGTVLVRLLTLT